jgi:hypothetical protein
MQGKNQILKTSVGAMVPGGVTKERKERKGWERSSSKNGERQQGMEEDYSILCPDPEWRAGSQTYILILGFGTIC